MYTHLRQKYGTTLKVIGPSVFFVFTIIMFLIFSGLQITRAIAIYGGIIFLLILMKISNDSPVAKPQLQSISHYADMLYSWTLGFWLTIDLVLTSYNSIVGILVLLLNTFGILFIVGIELDTRLGNSFLISVAFRSLIIVGSFIMALVAFYSIIVGEWIWPYLFVL